MRAPGMQRRHCNQTQIHRLARKASDMNKAAPSQRWFAAWRASERQPQDDPADLGTAFGLDMSLNELVHEPASPPPPAPRPGWMRRLAAGRKPSA
jgi:hypothetical protein